MKQLLKAEQLMQLALCIAALYYQPIHIAWWLWVPLFLSPDLGMVGYLVNAKVGAILYNAVHHKGVAGGLIIAGFVCHLPVILFIGLLLWAHSSFDRIMGYGLKYNDSFQHTHLGMIGKQTQ
ncbi:MAG: hypothetical protein JWQ38_2248 [Flavipsychrobacter sp.]|nr:hypothetical protein [Flavipsychrobacter sp.]